VLILQLSYYSKAPCSLSGPHPEQLLVQTLLPQEALYSSPSKLVAPLLLSGLEPVGHQDPCFWPMLLAGGNSIQLVI